MIVVSTSSLSNCWLQAIWKILPTCLPHNLCLALPSCLLCADKTGQHQALICSSLVKVASEAFSPELLLV